MPSLLSILRRTEARFGLTRGDVTVALFLSCAALIGFAYVQFFETPHEIARRTELLKLAGLHDSVTAAREALTHGGFHSAVADSDSVALPWEPLTEEEVLEDGTSGSSGIGRSRKLTLKDVAPININTAAAAVLELLPGVGEKTAGQMIAYRRAKPFRRIEDVMNVKGIGPKKFEEMKPYITVGQGAADAGAGAGADAEEDSNATRK